MVLSFESFDELIQIKVIEQDLPVIPFIVLEQLQFGNINFYSADEIPIKRKLFIYRA